MSHTDHQTDFDPNTDEIELAGHWHHVVDDYECLDEQEHEVDQTGAQIQVAIKEVDAPDFVEYPVLLTFPDVDLQIPAKKDGYVETKQRQRFANGGWSKWTTPKSVEINLQPPVQPPAPTFEVLSRTETHAKTRIHFHWSDRDVQGNVIKPAQAFFLLKHSCASGEAKGWQTIANARYFDENNTAQHHVDVMIPLGEGTRTYLLAQYQTNLCRIKSKQSKTTVLPLINSVPLTGGSHHVDRGCLS